MPARRRGEAQRPVKPFFRVSGFNSFCRHRARGGLNDAKRDVAQLGSASALGAEGRTFKSCHPDKQDFSPRSSVDRAPASEAGGPEFNSRRGYFASIAQSGPEPPTFNRRVAGSNPAGGTRPHRRPNLGR